jgi:hypothetical protein
MANGAVQYAFTGNTYTTPVGYIVGGEWGDNANPITIEGIGGAGVIVGGPTQAECSLEVAPVDANGLLDKILRTTAGTYGGYPAGEPPAFKLHVGDDADGLYLATWQVASAGINFAVGDVLKVSYKLIGTGKPTRGLNANTYTIAQTPFIWHDGSVQIDSANAEVISCDLSVENGLKAYHTLNAKSADSRRWNDGADSGSEIITCNLTLRENPGHELDEDELEEADIVLTAVNTAESPLTATFTLSNAKPTVQNTRLVPASSQREWTVTYNANPNEGALVITVA